MGAGEVMISSDDQRRGEDLTDSGGGTVLPSTAFDEPMPSQSILPGESGHDVSRRNAGGDARTHVLPHFSHPNGLTLRWIRLCRFKSWLRFCDAQLQPWELLKMNSRSSGHTRRT